MKVAAVFATVAVLSFFCTACAKGDLRGSSAASDDGKTYLVVVDDNGGKCGPIKVDGKVWHYAIGKPGSINPDGTPSNAAGRWPSTFVKASYTSSIIGDRKTGEADIRHLTR